MTAALQIQNHGLKAMLLNAAPSIQAMIPPTIKLDADRIVRIALLACDRDHKLSSCTPKSILGSIAQSSQLGLEIGGVSGHSYLVPFRNRTTGKYEAQFIPGYRGLIQLVWRAARIDIESAAVHDGDDFSFRRGTDPHLHHVPLLADGPVHRGDALAYWALARFPDSRTKFDVMTLPEIDSIRARSQSGRSDFSPWTTDFDEMARKTVVRRLVKYLPTDNTELSKAIEIDNRAADGKTTPLSDVLDMPADDPPQASPAAERVKARGRKVKAAPISDEEKAALEQREYEDRIAAGEADDRAT